MGYEEARHVQEIGYGCHNDVQVELSYNQGMVDRKIIWILLTRWQQCLATRWCKCFAISILFRLNFESCYWRFARDCFNFIFPPWLWGSCLKNISPLWMKQSPHIIWLLRRFWEDDALMKHSSCLGYGNNLKLCFAIGSVRTCNYNFQMQVLNM